MTDTLTERETSILDVLTRVERLPSLHVALATISDWKNYANRPKLPDTVKSSQDFAVTFDYISKTYGNCNSHYFALLDMATAFTDRECVVTGDAIALAISNREIGQLRNVLTQHLMDMDQCALHISEDTLWFLVTRSEDLDKESEVTHDYGSLIEPVCSFEHLLRIYCFARINMFLSRNMLARLHRSESVLHAQMNDNDKGKRPRMNETDDSACRPSPPASPLEIDVDTVMQDMRPFTNKPDSSVDLTYAVTTNVTATSLEAQMSSTQLSSSATLEATTGTSSITAKIRCVRVLPRLTALHFKSIRTQMLVQTEKPILEYTGIELLDALEVIALTWRNIKYDSTMASYIDLLLLRYAMFARYACKPEEYGDEKLHKLPNMNSNNGRPSEAATSGDQLCTPSRFFSGCATARFRSFLEISWAMAQQKLVTAAQMRHRMKNALAKMMQIGDTLSPGTSSSTTTTINTAAKLPEFEPRKGADEVMTLLIKYATDSACVSIIRDTHSKLNTACSVGPGDAGVMYQHDKTYCNVPKTTSFVIHGKKYVFDTFWNSAIRRPADILREGRAEIEDDISALPMPAELTNASANTTFRRRHTHYWRSEYPIEVEVAGICAFDALFRGKYFTGWASEFLATYIRHKAMVRDGIIGISNLEEDMIISHKSDSMLCDENAVMVAAEEEGTHLEPHTASTSSLIADVGGHYNHGHQSEDEEITQLAIPVDIARSRLIPRICMIANGFDVIFDGVRMETSSVFEAIAWWLEIVLSVHGGNIPLMDPKSVASKRAKGKMSNTIMTEVKRILQASNTAKPKKQGQQDRQHSDLQAVPPSLPIHTQPEVITVANLQSAFDVNASSSRGTHSVSARSLDDITSVSKHCDEHRLLCDIMQLCRVVRLGASSFASENPTEKIKITSPTTIETLCGQQRTVIME
jgi:hypothetical protein